MSRRLITVLVLAACTGIARGEEQAVVAPTPALVPYTATYSVSRGSLRLGEMRTELLAPSGGPWTYHSVGRTTGLASLLRSGGIEETSIFTVDNGRIISQSHVYRMPGSRRNRDFSLVFDWSQELITGDVRGEPVSEALPAGAVDRHAMPVAVLLDLAVNNTFPRRYVMVDRGRVRELDARIDRNERIETAAGMFETTVVVQQRLDNPERRYLIWVAEDAAGLFPVRIASVDDDGADMVLELTALAR